MHWIMILIIGGPLGAAIYFAAVILPDLLGGRAARQAGALARNALNPERDFHAALKRLEESPTVDARIKVAQAATALGRWSDAEAQWALCVDGLWANDPVILAGHAGALLELGRPADALERLERLQSADAAAAAAPQMALLFARAYEGLGRHDEADAPYRFAADRVPGLEAGARYVAFMAKAGRLADAEIGLGEIERRLAKIAGPLKSEARAWRDLAAKAVAERKPSGVQ